MKCFHCLNEILVADTRDKIYSYKGYSLQVATSGLFCSACDECVLVGDQYDELAKSTDSFRKKIDFMIGNDIEKVQFSSIMLRHPELWDEVIIDRVSFPS